MAHGRLVNSTWLLPSLLRLASLAQQRLRGCVVVASEAHCRTIITNYNLALWPPCSGLFVLTIHFLGCFVCRQSGYYLAAEVRRCFGVFWLVFAHIRTARKFDQAMSCHVNVGAILLQHPSFIGFVFESTSAHTARCSMLACRCTTVT
jgi:hypothetical protein